MIKYLGSKRRLLPAIIREIQNIPDVHTVVDVFSGTSRVGIAMKSMGYKVYSNDYSHFAHALAKCHVETDPSAEILNDTIQLIGEFNELKGSSGYFTETFCVKSKFFQPKNGERIDAIREEIAEKSLNPSLEAVLLTSLMEAADRVDSTVGVQMAYLKEWSPRSHKDIQLKVPHMVLSGPNGKSKASRNDVFDFLEDMRFVKADLAYIDPPYNQHSYLGNYHIWESLVQWDKPAVYGVACKREDIKQRKSPFNSKPQFEHTMRRLLTNINARHIILSFSDEGFLSKDKLLDMLHSIYSPGSIQVREFLYPRYVGSRIGIHNPQGEKVGEVGSLINKEFLFVIDRSV